VQGDGLAQDRGIMEQAHLRPSGHVMPAGNTRRSCSKDSQYRVAVPYGLLLGLGRRQFGIGCRLSPSSDSALGPRKPKPWPTLFSSSSWMGARSALASVLPAFRQQRAHHACQLSPAAGDQPRGRASSPHPTLPNVPRPLAAEPLSPLADRELLPIRPLLLANSALHSGLTSPRRCLDQRR
jgi:hypothetical protein